MRTQFALTKDQQKIFDKTLAGENIFLTGKAGTGKSYLIQHMIRHFEKEGLNVIKCAPTALAAQNINGVTINRAFGIKKLIAKTPLTENPAKIPDYLEYADVILIDEISMCRRDVFEYAVKCIKEAESKSGRKIQIIVSGDYSQLPPVVEKELIEPLCDYYGVDDLAGCYAFQSSLWKDLKLKTCILTKVLRQDDPAFIEALELARKGNSDCIPYILNNSSRSYIPNAITVVGKNSRVKVLNDKGLSEVEGPEFYVQAEVNGHGIRVGEDTIAERDLKAKVGARVMLTVDGNDSRGVPYYAGDFGTIVAYAPGFLTIELDAGSCIKLKKRTFPVTGYRLTESPSGRKVISVVKEGVVVQFPVCLGYAITVHKSEGLTFDKMNFEPLTWLPGQFYAAVSRCRSIKNLHVSGALKKDSVLAQKEAIRFIDSYESNDVKEDIEEPSISDTENAYEELSDPEVPDSEPVESFEASFDPTEGYEDPEESLPFGADDSEDALSEEPVSENSMPEQTDPTEVDFLATPSETPEDESFVNEPADIGSSVEMSNADDSDALGDITEDDPVLSNKSDSSAESEKRVSLDTGDVPTDEYPEVKADFNAHSALLPDVMYIDMKKPEEKPTRQTFQVSKETWENWKKFTDNMPAKSVAMDEALNLFMKMCKEGKIKFIISF